MVPLTVELYRHVCTVLFEEWDPIGVNAMADCLNVEDEYDSYAAELIRLIHEGANDATVVHHLIEIARTRMGLTETNVERDRNVARHLISIVRG